MAFSTGAFNTFKPATTTTSAPQQNAFGTFGTQQQQPQQQQPGAGTNAFGQASGQQQQQQQQQAQPSTNLFGQPAQSQANPFGQSTTQPATAGAGLFGQSQAGGTNPFGQAAGGAGLFGQPTAQPSGTGAGLFGQPANAQQQQQQQPAQQMGAFGGGLFSATSTAQASAQPATGGFGLFGSTAGQQQQQQQQPAQTGGLFGSTAGAPAAASSFGGFGGNSLLSVKPPAAAPVANTQPMFTKQTKFNDLPPDVQKTLEQIEAHIQGRIQISNALKTRKLGDEIAAEQERVQAVYRDVLRTQSVVRQDVLLKTDLGGRVDQSISDTIAAREIIDAFRAPQHAGAREAHAHFPLDFFGRAAGEMRDKLAWYKAAVEQIERRLAGAAAQSAQSPAAIASTLQNQHATFVGLAGQVAAVHAELEKVKTVYTQLWRAKTGSMRDPFEDGAEW